MATKQEKIDMALEEYNKVCDAALMEYKKVRDTAKDD